VSARLERRRLAGMAASFVVVAMAFLAYQRFDVGAMLADLRMVTALVSGW
jgi:hypothetical protein